MRVSELFYYPVKSLAGIAVNSLNINQWGPDRDRRLMLVDEDGHFITQRKHHLMARISVSDTPQGLLFEYDKHHKKMCIAWPDLNAMTQSMPVEIWEEHLNGQIIEGEINGWFSEIFNSPIQLVYMDETEIRQVDVRYAKQGVRTSFSDGFPFLLMSQSSVDFLQQQYGKTVDVRQFRPNIVIDDCAAFEEDHWKRIAINGIQFDLVKPCSRCVIPSIDVQTGEMQKDFMQVLLAHRKIGSEIVVGQNMTHTGEGEVSVGDRVVVLE